MEFTTEPRRLRRSGAGACLFMVLTGSAAAQVTSIVSTDLNGSPSGKDCFDPAISIDGRYVGFFSYDNLLGSGPEFVHSDTYLRDRVTGALERISVNSNEVQGDSFSYTPSFSADVRYVAFVSYATNLVSGDTNGPYPEGLDVFVRDRVNGTTERASVGTGGVQGNGASYSNAISAEGRYVAFYSVASNLVAGDTNGVSDVFVRDRTSGTTERVSLSAGGGEGNGASSVPTLSAEGRYVAFYSVASDFVAGDTNGVADVFLRDRAGNTIERVSVASSGVEGDDDSFIATMTPDGRYVAFASRATNLVPGDTNGVFDIFVRDLQSGTTDRVSVGAGGVQSDRDSQAPSITPDGRYVAFQSDATTLVSGDTNGRRDIFVHDRQSGRTQRASVSSSGDQGTADSGIYGPAISADGRYVAFDTRASFVAMDSNSWHDVYVRDRDYVPLTSRCSPGIDGVIACPCSNPPSGADRGCDNTAGTGGANLSGSGIAHLSTDSLVLVTTGQNPTATSVVVQADAFAASGSVFGQGVRCASGALRRLYTKSASGGSITAPDFGAGDVSVSERSAAVGDPLQPGQTRWYFVYYRDPVVHGGCAATSTFNVTQTGEVVWLP